MAGKKKIEPFYKRHILGWAMSAVTLAAAGTANAFYRAFRAPLEASIAARQVNDSAADLVLYQQMNHHNLVPNLIWALAVWIVILILIPTIKDLIETGGK